MTVSSLWCLGVCLGLFIALPPRSLQLQCLICFNVPVNCITSATPSNATPPIGVAGSYMCEVNTTDCSIETCPPSPSICFGSILVPPNQDFTQAEDFTSGCFKRIDNTCHADVTEGCDLYVDRIPFPLPSGKYQHECCCNESDCVSEEFSVLPVLDEVTNATSPDHTIGLDVILSVTFPLVLVPTLFCSLCVIVMVIRNYIKRKRYCSSEVIEIGGIPNRYGDPVVAKQPLVLQGLIGQGKFGHVYKAVYNEKMVAVKAYSEQNQRSWTTERELFSMDSTQHDNMVEYITSDDGSFISLSIPHQLILITHYYPLGSLVSYLRGNVVSWKQACTVVKSIASGLTHLHSDYYVSEGDVRIEKYPIAHRDIKSSNILLKNENGECVICDLGLGIQLMPTNDPQEISNYGQVGTARYMSPEALDARVNLLNMESFKQIDVYAFSLIMWEVLSRCCVLTSDSVDPYRLPYEDLVVHATLNNVKDIVCTRQLRPPIPALWSNHEPLLTYVCMMEECWDKDPDARLTAANIYYQISDLYNLSLQHLRDNSQQTPVHATQTPLSRNHSLLSHVTNLAPMLNMEDSQSGPPPCYCPTDPYQNLDRSGMRRLQTSMPHIAHITHAVGEGEESVTMEIVPRSSRSLRSSVTQSFHYHGDRHRPPVSSVRNSLVLGERRVSLRDERLPVFSDGSSEEGGDVLQHSSNSVHGMGVGQEEPAETVRVESSELDQDQSSVPRTDSGIQIAHFDSPHSHSVTHSNSPHSNSVSPRSHSIVES